MDLIERQRINYFLSVLFLVFTLHFRSTSEILSVKGDQDKSVRLTAISTQIAPRFDFRNIQGLNSNQVSSICQDKYGFIWIGTLNGLHRFDGTNMRLFLNDPLDSTSLVLDRIDRVYEDMDANLWIGTSGGICKYNRDLDNFERFKATCGFIPMNSPHPHRILDFKEDKYGTLWIISNREGLLYFDEDLNDFMSFFEEGDMQKLTSFNFSAFEIDEAGNFWLGTFDSGINIVNPNTRVIRQVEAGGRLSQLYDNKINDIMSDESGLVWVGTESGGISRFDLSNDRITSDIFIHSSHNPNSLRNNEVQSVYQDSKGQIWSCNVNGGLHLYDSLIDGFYHYSADAQNRHSLSSNSIWTIFEDRDQRLWVGSGLTGIDVWDENFTKFEHYFISPDAESGLKSNVIRGFEQDSQGRIWLASDGGGLSLVNDDGSFTTFQKNDSDIHSLSTDAVLSVKEGFDGNLWLGTWAGGVNIFNPSTQKSSLYKGVGAENLIDVFHIIKDGEDNLWFATYSGGLNKLDSKTGTLVNYMHDPNNDKTIASDLMHTLFEDSRGDIYIGVRNMGLNVLKKENISKGIFDRYNNDREDSLSLPSSTVNMILEDSYGTIWIATSGGLCTFNRVDGIFHRVHPKTGLSHSDIRGLIEDENENLWVRTHDGLTKLEIKSLETIDYGVSEGVQKGSFLRHTIFRSDQGEIMFGGKLGFNMFHPDSLESKSEPPGVYLTNFKLQNKDITYHRDSPILDKHIAEAQQIVLGPEDLRFTIEYVAINFTRAENNQYAYKMEGLENEWNYVENVTNATYNNLPPGAYRFVVKGANHDQQWNEEGASISILVQPDWYETWWARVFFSGLGIYLILLIVRWRTGRLKDAKKKLELVVARRTLQLTEKNAEILKQAQELQQKNAELGVLNSSISQQAEELKTYNDALNEMNENLEGLVKDRTKNLEKKNAELIKYSYTNAHMVRGPLTRILGLINLLKNDKPSSLANWMKKIEDSTLEMDQITRKISKKLDQQIKKEEEF